MTSDPATATDADWLACLLQAGDSFYPTGSYAHSFGLEGLVQAGVVHDRESLGRFLRHSTLPGLRQADLPLAAHAWRALAEPADWPAVEKLSHLAHALKSAREAREAAERIGRQRVELTASLHNHALAREYLARARAGDWPCAPAIAAALEGRIFGAPLRAVLIGVSYAALAGAIAAAMKLMRLGQLGAQTLLAELLADVPAIVRQAEAIPVEAIGWFNPWLDIAAARHETSDFRLFIS